MEIFLLTLVYVVKYSYRMLNSNFIRARRQELGLTQVEAARLAGMAQPRWAELENGRRANPRLEWLEKIAKILRCKLTQIVTD